MTAFEFVFALIAIITSLALTHIVTGIVDIVRNMERGGFSVSHALWVWIAFVVLIGNWGVLWNARIDPEWPALRVLAWLASMTSLYAFCALVIPNAKAASPLNLAEFHESEGRRYILAHNVFAGLALLLVISVGTAGVQSVQNILAPIGALLLGIGAFLTHGRAQLIVSLLLAILATLFMLANVSTLTV